MFEAGLVGLLLSDQNVVAAIGARLYSIQLPENATLPAATYQIVSGSTPDRTFANALRRMKRVQFDFWGDASKTGNAYKQVKGLELAVAKVLDGFTGTLSDGSRVLIAERGLTVDNLDTSSRFYRVLNEYEFTYVE